MVNKHQIQKDFYTNRNEWINSFNKIHNENVEKRTKKQVPVTFDSELDPNGPKECFVENKEEVFAPKKVDYEIDSGFDR